MHLSSIHLKAIIHNNNRGGGRGKGERERGREGGKEVIYPLPSSLFTRFPPSPLLSIPLPLLSSLSSSAPLYPSPSLLLLSIPSSLSNNR